MTTQNRKFIPEVRDAQHYHPAEHFGRMVVGLEEQIAEVKEEMLSLTPNADNTLKHVIIYRVLQGKLELLEELLERGGCDAKTSEFKRYGSARTLYNFDIDNAAAY